VIELHLTDTWPAERIAPDIVRCLDKVAGVFPERVTTAYVLERVMTGAAKLWIVTDDGKLIMAFTTEEETVDATGCHVLTLSQCGGERLHEVLEACMPQLEAWAKARGAELLEMPGRAGWARMMKPYGFAPAVQILAKRIA
jgi:hypothetical protein